MFENLDVHLDVDVDVNVGVDVDVHVDVKAAVDTGMGKLGWETPVQGSSRHHTKEATVNVGFEIAVAFNGTTVRARPARSRKPLITLPSTPTSRTHVPIPRSSTYGLTSSFLPTPRLESDPHFHLAFETTNWR